jgi:two-component system chemotaxis response regulator CheB
VSVAAGGDIRAVVVDDSRFMRTLIRQLLEDDGITVVGEAGDGVAAVERVSEHRPDVVTMDIEMPKANGIEAVENIMSERPTPVLMLSAHAEEDADVTFEALDRGAVDFVTKPGGEVTSEMSRVRRELVEKVQAAAAVDLSATGSGSTRRERDSASGTDRRDRGRGRTGAARSYPDVATLVVGASTGGPNVVEDLLASLPREANLRILVVQHMPEGFTERFAQRLDRKSPYDVREATDGDRIGPGEGRVAPGGSHLLVGSDRGGRLRLKLSDAPQVHGVRPAIDLTMASVAETVQGPVAGVLLTGMGRDGVDGMGRIQRRGGHTVAQDEATSAIFGMPKRAIESGHADTVLPAGDVADGVLRAIGSE